MGLVPEVLDKYFRTRSGLLKKNGNYFTELNRHLREQMGFGVKEDVGKLRIEGKKSPLYFVINKKTVHQAMSLSCFGTLRDVEKARTLYLFINRYMNDNYPELEVPTLNFIPSREHQHYISDALYCEGQGGRKNFVFINPNNLNKYSGINFANYIAHELQHCKDFHTIKNETLPMLNKRYTQSKSLNNYDEIINLPLYGKIYNYELNKEEEISPTLRETILTTKSYLAGIHIKSKIFDINKVQTSEDMYNYLECIAYQSSPLEQRAFGKGAEFANQLVNENDKFGAKSDLDRTFAKELTDVNNNIAKQFIIVEKLTNLPINAICNLFTQATYFSNMSQTNTKYKTKLDEIRKQIDEIVSTAMKNNTPEQSM